MLILIEKSKTIEMGSGDSITLDKLYGPTIFARLRITATPSRGWVIERETADRHNDEPDLTSIWVEWCTIPCQLDMDFEKEIQDAKDPGRQNGPPA